MSEAGLSLETATRRGRGCEGVGRAECMRVRIEERFWLRVEARVGEMGISEEEVIVGEKLVGSFHGDLMQHREKDLILDDRLVEVFRYG